MWWTNGILTMFFSAESHYISAMVHFKAKFGGSKHNCRYTGHFYQNIQFRKFKMADDRHFENVY